jgi:hypothetical protein
MISTPIVSALKNYHFLGFLEVPADIGYFKPLLDSGGRFISETAARRLKKQNGRHETASEAKR